MRLRFIRNHLQTGFQHGRAKNIKFNTEVIEHAGCRFHLLFGKPGAVRTGIGEYFAKTRTRRDVLGDLFPATFLLNPLQRKELWLSPGKWSHYRGRLSAKFLLQCRQEWRYLVYCMEQTPIVVYAVFKHFESQRLQYFLHRIGMIILATQFFRDNGT